MGKEKNVEQKEAIKKVTENEEKPKTIFGKTLAFLSDKFLRPSIITVFITAILGPVAIQWVNDSFENKKLQKEVIQTVLKYTSEADFSKPESVEKISIISRMVDENQGVFQLSFEETTKAIDMLNEASKDVGIKNLSKKRDDAIKNIKELNIKLTADSAIFANFIIEKENIISQIEKFKKRKNRNKIAEYENNLARIELDIKEINNNRDFYRMRIKHWNEQKEILDKDIQAATEDLSRVLTKNRDNQKILKQEKEKLKEELVKNNSEINLLKEKISELENKNRKLSDSLNIFKITKEK